MVQHLEPKYHSHTLRLNPVQLFYDYLFQKQVLIWSRHHQYQKQERGFYNFWVSQT